jgi:uncharacterized GH25 family protein
MRRPLQLLLASTFVLAPSLAGAHGLWIAERWGELGVIYGHGAGDDPYDPAKIISVRAVDGKGRELAIGLDKAERHALLATTGEPAVVLVDLDNGVYSKGADGTSVNKPKREVPGATEANHSIKHALAIVDLHGEMPEVPSQPLQILPLSNPLEAKGGDKLRVRVLLDGEPLAGVKLIPDYTGADIPAPDATAENGEAVITIPRDGLNVIAASHVVALKDDPDADKRSHTATLSFVAGAEHEH